MVRDEGFPARVRRIDELVRGIEQGHDPGTRAMARDLSREILDLHGAALERIVELMGGEWHARAADDVLIGGVLGMHGLHPVPLEERVRQALARLAPGLGADAVLELQGIEEGTVHVRVVGVSDEELAQVETALLAAAPDAAVLDVHREEPPTPLRELGEGEERD